MKSGSIVSIVAVALLASLTSGDALAQDAAVVNPKTVTVKLENPSVRVLETVLNPGQKEQLHSHPASVVYVIAGGMVRSHMTSGEPVESELKTGATIYREPVTHWTENIGTTPIHLVIVELKDRK
jgi:quercetin dioxygenase-like cupin family protein